jgi:mono/diheme cytochrome c family protein
MRTLINFVAGIACGALTAAAICVIPLLAASASAAVVQGATLPANATPANPTPTNPTPANPTPANPTPANPTPANPTPANPASATPAAAGAATLQSRGAYLATLGDCAACHTAGSNSPLYGGGKAVNSPFGKIYSTNISPDPDKGIGRYTLEDFTRALREGVRRDGKRLYPAMPYASFAAMSDSDLKDLYRYFMQEVKPVAFTPTETRLIFPFNQRWALTIWDGLFKNQEVFQADASRDTLWNRGAYLVRGLGHCGSCHTPRGVGYQEKGYSEASPDFVSGGVVDHWFAANLRGDLASGLGRWTEQDIVDFLRTGRGGGAATFGSMAEVVHDSTQHFHEEDLHAVAHYLKSLSAVGSRSSYRPQEVSAPIQAEEGGSTLLIEKAGNGLFQADCAKCHGAQGGGKPPRFPALAGNPMVLADDPSSIIRLILEGGTPPTTAAVPKPEKMPAFSAMTNGQIADVVNFVRSSWGNNAPRVSAVTVQTMRNDLKE